MTAPFARLFEALAGFTSDTASAYQAKGLLLQTDVDMTLIGRNDLNRLIGWNPVETMTTNHANHHRFLSTVFALGEGELLRVIVPWVYRAYRAHGFSYDYFPLELAAWRSACMRHLSPEHAAPVARFYEAFEAMHPDLVAIAEAGPPTVQTPAESPASRKMTSLLVEGNDRACLSAATAAVGGSDAVAAFYVHTLTPSLHEVGRLWESGRISTAIEHLATSIVSRVMATLYTHIAPSKGKSRGKAIISCAPNEFHEVGARMLADLLEIDGWNVRYLGANTPSRDIVSLVEADCADLLAISVCMPYGLDVARDLIRDVRSRPGLGGTRILVGGQAFMLVEDLWRKIGADGFAATADEAVVTARNLSTLPE